MPETIILTRRWPDVVEQHLATRYQVAGNPEDAPMTRSQLAEALQTADALCPTVTDRVDAELLVIQDLRARIIASYGVGFEHIDLEAAEARGITVTNTPDVLTDSTADLAMTLLLTAARRAAEGERLVRAGAWDGWRPTQMLGTHVTGKTIGIVGRGRCDRAHHGFGMRVIYYTPNPPAANIVRDLRARACDSLEALLREADFVSLHCPSRPETRHLMNAARLHQMRSTALLINTARGDIVDSSALARALRTGAIAGAALDVYEHEPSVPQSLLDQPNVVLLPHLGSATTETRIAMGMRVAANLHAFFAGDEPPDRLV